jgi:CBS domain-containing protein
MNVNEAMTSTVKTCHANSSLDEIARLMWDNDCGAIPVVSDSNKPLGIVTDRDIAMAAMLNHKPLWDISADTVIQGQRLCCCSQQESLEQCITKMEQNGVRRLLVTDDSGTLAGILSMGDAVAFTQSANGKRRTRGVNIDETFDMLRKVSAHHQAPEQPVIRVS